MRMEDHQRPVSHLMAERHFGNPRSETLIILDDLEEVPSSMPRQSVTEPREVLPVRSCGAWEGADVWRRHHRSSRRSPPVHRQKHHHRSSSSLSSSSSSLRERHLPQLHRRELLDRGAETCRGPSAFSTAGAPAGNRCRLRPATVVPVVCKLLDLGHAVLGHAELGQFL